MAFIVNGEKIEDSEIADELEAIKEHYLNAGEAVHCERDEEFLAYAKENLINRVLLEQASLNQFGGLSDADVDAKFNQIVSEHGGTDTFYENTGFNRGDEFRLRRKVKSGMLVDRYLDDQMGNPAPPNQDELSAFYKKNQTNYLTDVEVEVNQLFIEPDSHEHAKQVYDDLYKLRLDLLSNGNFVTKSAKFCDRDEGDIKMGYITQGHHLPEIESTIFSMIPGEISPIIPTRFGFHMFEVTGRKEPQPIPIEEIQNLEETYILDRRENAIDKIIKTLIEQASIEETTESD